MFWMSSHSYRWLALLRAWFCQADQGLQEVGARFVLWQISRAKHLEVAEALWVSVEFERAVQRARCVVAVKKLQVRVRGKTQVHVAAWGIVHSGGGGVGEALERVVIEEVSCLVCIFIEVICQGGPAHIVCEYVGGQWSRTVCRCAARGSRVAVVLCQWVCYVPQLATRRVVTIVTDAEGSWQPAIDFREILTPVKASSSVRVRWGARRLSHVAAAAVLLDDQPLRHERKRGSWGHGERKIVVLHGETKGAGLALCTLRHMGLILVCILLRVLWKSFLVLLTLCFILQLPLQFEPHGGVDVVSLHSSGVELDPALSIPAAVLCAATREVEAVHLIF